jgi:Sulfotransferase family
MSTSLRDFFPSLRQAFARNNRAEESTLHAESPRRTVTSIFLLNPFFSGSTAMAALLLQSPIAWAAWPNGEGQWVPEVKEEMRREPWNPDAALDWARIREVWLRLKPPDRSILVEKSPPNMVRARSLLEAFPDSVFVISNRDPYAWLGSILHRNPLDLDLDDPQERTQAIRRYVTAWVNRSRIQIDNVKLLRGRSVITTYELFCASHEVFLHNLYNYCGDLKVDPRAPLQVKDYPPQPLINMNPRQTALLTSADIALANEILALDQELLSFYGYQLLPEPRS